MSTGRSWLSPACDQRQHQRIFRRDCAARARKCSRVMIVALERSKLDGPSSSGLFPKSIRSKMAIHADPRLRNKTRSFLDLSTARREVLKVAWVVANGNAP